MKEADLYIDCIFGTGIDREVSGFYRRIINFLNVVDKPVISIDIPSGLDCNSGKALGAAVKAETTVTFVIPKIGMCIYPGVDYVGKLFIADITTPKILEEKLPYELLTFEGINEIIKTRDSDSHKGSHGHLLVIAGSKGKSGAAILAANGAVRSGAGLVTICSPACVNNIIEANTIEAMSAELMDTNEGSISNNSAKKAVNILNDKKSALAIGPGLTTNKSTKLFFKEILLNLSVPAIIDADGINILSDNLGLLKKIDVPIILTPHPGEMARLCKLPINEVQENRIDISLEFAKKHNCYLVLKGAKSIIADPDGNIFINPTGNPAMASGGMGDVLTGIIGSLLAQGYSPIDSCKLGTFIHGYTADLTVQEFGAPGIIASDVVENIPSSFKNIESQKELYFNII